MSQTFDGDARDLGDELEVLVEVEHGEIGQLGCRRDEQVGDRRGPATGEPDIPIHVIGGIADGVTNADLGAMVAAIEDRGAIGGSLYDWNTSRPWATLAPLAELRAG